MGLSRLQNNALRTRDIWNGSKNLCVLVNGFDFGKQGPALRLQRSPHFPERTWLSRYLKTSRISLSSIELVVHARTLRQKLENELTEPSWFRVASSAATESELTRRSLAHKSSYIVFCCQHEMGGGFQSMYSLSWQSSFDQRDDVRNFGNNARAR